MREMKDSGVEWIGEIPIDWDVSKIKFVAKSNQDTLTEDTPATQMIDYIDIGSVTYTNGIELVQKYPFDEAPSRARRVVHAGDTIISTVRTYLKAVAYIEIEYDSYIASTGFSVLTPNQGLNSKYLYYAISSHSFISEVESNSVGISYPAINNSVLVGLKSAFPSLKTQHRIADYLDAKCAQIDRAIARQQEVIEKLKEYKLSVITEAVTKGLNPDVPMKDSGIEWIGEIPEHWEISKVKYVAQIQPKCSFENISPETPITYAPMECIKQGYFISNETNFGELSTSLNAFEEGDIVLAKVTPCFENGNVAIMTGIKSGIGMGSSELFVFRPTKISTKHLLYWLQNYFFKQMGCATMTGTGGLKRVSPYFIANCEIQLPPQNEQQAMVEELDKACSSIDNAIAQKLLIIDKLTEYKKSLIYEVVTGKREV